MVLPGISCDFSCLGRIGIVSFVGTCPVGDDACATGSVKALKPLNRQRTTGMAIKLYASKMIMRPERESEEPLDPCPGQTDCRYGAEPLRESGPATENAVPD